MVMLKEKLNYFNRRRNSRMKVDMPVRFSVEYPSFLHILFDGKQIEAKTIDIGEGGMALITDHFIPKNAELMVKFSLDVNKDNINLNIPNIRLLRIDADVRSISAINENEYRMGVAFFKKTVEAKRELNRFIKIRN